MYRFLSSLCFGSVVSRGETFQYARAIRHSVEYRRSPAQPIYAFSAFPDSRISSRLVNGPAAQFGGPQHIADQTREMVPGAEPALEIALHHHVVADLRVARSLGPFLY